MIDHYRQIQRQRAAGALDVSGFTLIELLIVIVVLGILAAVVVFALGGVTGKSVQSACNADAKTVQTAIAAYEAQTGTTPAAITLANYANTTGAGSDSYLVPTYLQSWPANTGSDYAISVAAGGQVQVTLSTTGTWSTGANPVFTTSATAVNYTASACAAATT